MRRRTVKLQCAAMCVLVALMGCSRHKKDVYREVETHNRILDCIDAIHILCEGGVDAPPSSNDGLVRWLRRHRPGLAVFHRVGAIDPASSGHTEGGRRGAARHRECRPGREVGGRRQR